MKDSVSIRLRGVNAREFRDLKDKVSGVETNVGLVRKLLSFYKANSPYLEQVKE